MASFTQEVGNPVDRTEDFTSRSRGVAVEESQRFSDAGGTAGLLSGLANLIPQIADVGEKAVEYDVQTQLYAANDATNRAFGVDLTTPDNSVLVPTTLDVPDEVAKELGSMKAIKKAAELGKKSNTEYQSSISTTLKKLYSRYQSPQMRDYIRQQSIAITGVDPDKGLREAAMRASGGSSKQELKDQEEAFRIIRDAYKAGDPNVQNMSMDELQAMDKWTAIRTFGPHLSAKAEIDQEKAGLELLDKKLDSTKRQAVEVAQKELSLNVSAKYRGELSAINKAIEDNPDGGWMTDQNVASALQTIGGLKATIEADVRTQLAENYSGFGLSTSEQNDIVNMAVAPFAAYEAAIKGKSGSQLEYLKNKVDTIDASAQAHLRNNDIVVREKALADVNRDFANWYRELALGIRKRNDPKVADQLERLAADINGITADRKPKSLSSAIDSWKNSGVTDNKSVGEMKNILREHIESFKEESIIGTDAANSKFVSIYGDENSNLFMKIPQTDRFKMIKDMFDEKAYSRAKEIDPSAVRLFDRRLQEAYDITNRTEIGGLMSESWWNSVKGLNVAEDGMLQVKAMTSLGRTSGVAPVNSNQLDRWNAITSGVINTYKADPAKAYRLIEGVIELYGSRDIERADKLKQAYRRSLLGETEEQPAQ